VAVVKLWHILDGIFIWEFFANLDYEWSVFRGRRRYLWTIWIYSLTRVCTLVSVIVNIVGLDSSSPINCQLWVIFLATSAYLAFAAASILIVIRIIAIWDRNWIVVVIAMTAWSTNVAFLIHSITILRSAWVPEQSVCGVLNTDSSNKNALATLVSDVVLLVTMLVGLLRLRRKDIMSGFVHLLWKQGVIWLFVATLAEVPPAVFLILNLNDPLNLMFQTPALIVMSIAATRMYRSLTDFTDSHGSSRSFDTYASQITGPKQIFEVHIPPRPLEVSVHRSSEDYPPAGQCAPYVPYGAESRSQNHFSC